jgi:hypothetical protein
MINIIFNVNGFYSCFLLELGCLQNGQARLPNAVKHTSCLCSKTWNIVTALHVIGHQDVCSTYCKVYHDLCYRTLVHFITHVGSFAETMSPDHQMHWIIENCKTVRAAQGMTIIVDALKMLSVKHEQLG